MQRVSIGAILAFWPSPSASGGGRDRKRSAG